MKFKPNTLLLLRLCIVVSITALSFFQPVMAQNGVGIVPVSRDEFVKMTDAEKSSLLHQWINDSRQYRVPELIEQKALAYYKENNIDERVYQKYKILFQTVCNEGLPLSNRLNACYFITANYDAAIFPVEVVREILNELVIKSK